jgi:hypothetical protein
MGIKQVLQADHIPVNKYTLIIAGMPNITFTKVAGLEYGIDIVDLPDRTRASGGNAQATEFTAEQPLHHTPEVSAMEAWFEENQDPISSTAKKAGTLVMTSGTGANLKTYSLTGVWPSKRKTPDLDFENAGDMAILEWSFQVDSIFPI